MVDRNEKQEMLIAKFEYLNEYAKIKYDNELRREDSIVKQASQMQMAFSFVTAALFMIAPIVIEYRKPLSLTFFLIAFATITTALLLSLLFATIAQNRKRSKSLINILDFMKYMEEKEGYFDTEEQRLKYTIQAYGEIQNEKADINDKRINNIRKSMFFFYIALAFCAFWFVVAVCKII